MKSLPLFWFQPWTLVALLAKHGDAQLKIDSQMCPKMKSIHNILSKMV
jgi:hypothetical protein